MAARLLESIVRLLNELKERGLIGPYAIGGAWAIIHYTEPFETDDIDVLAHLSPALNPLDAVYQYLVSRGGRVLGETVEIEGVPVQFLPVSGPLDEEAVAEAVELRIGKEITRILTAEHAVAIALQVGRSKDEQKIQRLLETPKKAIDMERLFLILRHHNLVDKWLRFQERNRGE